MNKKRAIELIQNRLGITDFDDFSDFFTVYYNLGDKKDLAWCNSANEAIEFIALKLTDKHQIAIEFDDYFFEELGDLKKYYNDDY